nr:OTU domain-containing protein 4 isoform X1 [Pogona vitticeps]
MEAGGDNKPRFEEEEEEGAAAQAQAPPPRSPPGGSVEVPAADSAMDAYLRSQGLYRKRVAKDGSCLFRAVAEQVFHSQSQHLDIRKACISYLQENREQFEAFIEGPFEQYLKSLENPQEWVGQVEISALSLMYKKDFIIYQEPNTTPSQVTENGFPDKILLCFSNGSHYDIVYPIEYTIRAALCQSILYEVLYEKVFGVDVSNILEELEPPGATKDGSWNNEASDSEDENMENEVSTDGLNPLVGNKHIPRHERANAIPLPRSVLGSLNPSIYQNVEYEVWQRSKRAQQKQDFSIAAGMQYSVGDKCEVRLDHGGRFYNAHIQEVQSSSEPIVVFVEELGVRQSVLLKNLKPLPQASPLESWNTVPGKKTKKPTPVYAQNIKTDAQSRGPKNPNKPIKAQSAVPPRLQSARQHHLSFSGGHSQQSSPEHRTSGRNPQQAARKADGERTEDLDGTNRDCSSTGFPPEECKEKQAVEEMHSLYGIQLQDEDDFPALSNPPVSQVATQSNDHSGWRKTSVLNGRRSSSQKEEKEERTCVEIKEEKEPNPGQTSLDQKLQSRVSKGSGKEAVEARISPPSSHGNSQSVSVEQNLQEPLSGVNPTLSTAFPKMHLSPSVPSVPAVVPAWPREPSTYGPTGVSPQIPVSAVMPTPALGLDSPLSQVTSNAVAGIPVPLQAVNQPLMPMPQTLNPYQDPLYPGFPLNEKGERVMVPPYSLCSTGVDLPEDKNILRFFFNLGVKAYSCPMWAPHSYLYPLHQACLSACRMYPKIPVAVYSPSPWMQEVPLTQNGNGAAHMDGRFPMQNEVGMNGQGPQTDALSPSMPLFIPAAQVPESQGLVCVESENPAQALHVDYESLGGKNIFPQPPFGQNPYLGPVPVFPHLCFGCPVQGYVDNSVGRHIVPPEDKRSDVGLSNECSSPVTEGGHTESHPEAKNESCAQGSPLPTGTVKSECSVPNKTSARVPKELQVCSATPSAAQAKSVFQKRSTETLDFKRQTSSTRKAELKSFALGHKEKTDKASAAASVSVGFEESRAQRPREDSSEDECQVSDVLKSGRSKQSYNQTFVGGRRPRSEQGYPSGRGAYQYPRNEDSWKGPATRNRDEGYQYHRTFRGRPYRHERRRGNMGDGHRGQQLS